MWKEWDPIGIDDSDNARDEYQAYVPTIFKLKISNTNQETIGLKLNEYATNYMGLTANLKHCNEIAKKVLDL